MTGNEAMDDAERAAPTGNQRRPAVTPPPVPRSDGRRTDSRRRPRGGRLASTRGHRPGRPVSMWPPAGLELRPLGSARTLGAKDRRLSFHGPGFPPPRASRKGGLWERGDSAPLRGEFLRWVPDRLPLRFAALQASGKALSRGSRQSLHGFPGRMQRKRNATRDPAQQAAAKRRRTHSQRSPQGRR
jgi:hypothetical protein